MEMVLQTKGLTKAYGKALAVNAVSMEIRRGDIYGLIGQNGAGKTTLMKLIAGLTAPGSGDIALFGSRNLDRQRKRLGTMIEYPAVYFGLTARENLEIACRLFGLSDRSCIENILTLVGLTDTGRKKARNFSLGMKQRLGLAMALIDRPDLLILDEPINGLDPKGVCELRDLILELNRNYGVTFLVSSHILGELEKIATRYGVIGQGVLRDEFDAGDLEERCKKRLVVETPEPEKAAAILTSHGFAGFYREGNRLFFTAAVERPENLNALLTTNGVPVSSFAVTGSTLEEYFLQRMGGEAI